jgi:hypothetical protein
MFFARYPGRTGEEAAVVAGYLQAFQAAYNWLGSFL